MPSLKITIQETKDNCHCKGNHRCWFTSLDQEGENESPVIKKIKTMFNCLTNGYLTFLFITNNSFAVTGVCVCVYGVFMNPIPNAIFKNMLTFSFIYIFLSAYMISVILPIFFTLQEEKVKK